MSGTRSHVPRRSELRLYGDGFRFAETRAKEGRQHVNGWSDFAVGTKISVFDERPRIPALSLVGSLSFPSGEDAFTSAAHDPGVGLVWSKKLAAWTAGGVFTFASVSNNFKRSLERSTALSVGFPPAAGMAFYSEVYNVRTGAEANSSVWAKR
jgi:hypothetical protein